MAFKRLFLIILLSFGFTSGMVKPTSFIGQWFFCFTNFEDGENACIYITFGEEQFMLLGSEKNRYNPAFMDGAHDYFVQNDSLIMNFEKVTDVWRIKVIDSIQINIMRAQGTVYLFKDLSMTKERLD